MVSKTPQFDSKIKEILDSLEPGERTCALTGEKWVMDEEEISWYRKFNVPPSVMHPHTRWQLAIGQYVGYQWWWHKHLETGEPLLSTTHPATGLKVLPDNEWYDKDFSSAGREYDSQISFFEQYRKLQLDVPMTATRNFKETENSIAAVSSGAINSYFTMGGTTKNDVFTMNSVSENSCLVNWCANAKDCFMVAATNNVFNSKYVLDSEDVMNSQFIYSCKDVEHCFFASNQSHKKYIWFDEQLTEGEYKKRIKEIDLSCRSTLKKYEQEYFQWLNETVIWPEANRINAPGCTGEYLMDCKNLVHSYACSYGVQNGYWVIHNYNDAEDNAFFVGGPTCSEIYYTVSSMKSSQIKFSSYLNQCRQVEYSMNCLNCEYCFGCAGLNRKKYHIFNKEYDEDEYWQRVDELKCAMLEQGEYGEFFPMSFSPSYQPYGGAAMYLLTEDNEYKQLGALEFDPESCGAVGQDLERATNPTPSSEAPDSIDDSPDQWIGKPLLDQKNNRLFTYLKPEVEFYKKHRLPLPEEHFIHRLMKLNSMSNGALFEKRECANCNNGVEIAKNKLFPDRNIYCKKCYLDYLEVNG
jgi:hypothetical protein